MRCYRWQPSDGLGLFIERALAVRPGFQVDEQVAAICEAVDELPLAIGARSGARPVDVDECDP